MATFANILYDDAFKVVLTEPSNNRLLIKLVEFFLPGKTIQSLTLDDKEQHGLILSDKNCTFDLFCTTDKGERIIVEMQFLAQSSFQERMLYYATYPIRSQILDTGTCRTKGPRVSKESCCSSCTTRRPLPIWTKDKCLTTTKL